MKHNFIAKDDCLLFTVLSNNLAGIPTNTLKFLAKKGEIKVNGIKQQSNIMIKKGDNLSIFVPLKLMPQKTSEIIYFDENIVIVSKPPFYDVENNLLSELRKEYPTALAVHRLDKNTSGLVVFALNQATYDSLLKAFKDRTIDKYYLAEVKGHFLKEGTLTAYLKKDEERAVVQISNTPKDGYVRIITEFNQIKNGFDSIKNTSLVKVKLITGKTHQIRAHLSYLGHPIIGDTKYGETIRRKDGYALIAYKMVFNELASPLEYLNKKTFSLSKTNIKPNIID